MSWAVRDPSLKTLCNCSQFYLLLPCLPLLEIVIAHRVSLPHFLSCTWVTPSRHLSYSDQLFFPSDPDAIAVVYVIFFHFCCKAMMIERSSKVRGLPNNCKRRALPEGGTLSRDTQSVGKTSGDLLKCLLTYMGRMLHIFD